MPIYKRVDCTHCLRSVELRKDEDKLKKNVCTHCGNMYNITDKNSNYYVDYIFEGKRFREKVGPSKALAETVLSKIKVEIAECRFLNIRKEKKINFCSFADEYLEKHSKVNNKTWKLYDKHNLNKLKKFFGDKTLTEINANLITKYKAERAKVVSVATVNRELALIKSIFNKAIAWEKYIGNNPAKFVKFFKENNQRTRFLTEVEIETLVSNCNGYLRPIVILVLNTGMRRGEVLKLKWNDVNFATNTICLKDTKNGENRYIPMNENVRQLLSQEPKNLSSEHIFYKRDGSSIGDIKRRFNTAIMKSGIKDFRFHDLRHTFASNLAMKGVDLNTIRELLGHKSLTMTIRYSHLSQEHKTRAVDVLSRQDAFPQVVHSQ